jgi:hypothetical protein
MSEVGRRFGFPANSMSKGSRDTCPYNTYPDSSFWARAVAGVDPETIDPVVRVSFQISRHHKIATAGSCFAQHLARNLSRNGLTHFVAETCPASIPEALQRRFGFGIFSARYGNIYTARQLMQLFDRAYGNLVPAEDVWEFNGTFLDPFRPHIQPQGFASLIEYSRDRKQHLGAVRRVFEQCDVFVFTLGLTEAWVARADGVVFPVCPGCGAGTFAPEKYAFVNFAYEDVLADMRGFLDRFRSVNPSAPVLLTVSPVALIATAEQRHVLVSTAYSKAVLRAVAGRLEQLYSEVSYFPSYELVTGCFGLGTFFGKDLRTVTEKGVEMVMQVFMRHYCKDAMNGPPISASGVAPPERPQMVDARALLESVCDEEQVDSMMQTGDQFRG